MFPYTAVLNACLREYRVCSGFQATQKEQPHVSQNAVSMSLPFSKIRQEDFQVRATYFCGQAIRFQSAVSYPVMS